MVVVVVANGVAQTGQCGAAERAAAQWESAASARQRRCSPGAAIHSMSRSLPPSPLSPSHVFPRPLLSPPPALRFPRGGRSG